MSELDNNGTSQFTDNLYDAIHAESIWPAEKRTIYCTVSGRPWATVSPDYVRETIRDYGIRNEQQMLKFIDRITIFAMPSPMWQSKTETMLIENKLQDPCGFLVYMLNDTLRLEKLIRKAVEADVMKLAEWYAQKRDVYAAFKKMPREFIERVSDALLMVSADGCTPPPNKLPSLELKDYASTDTLNTLMTSVHDYWFFWQRGRDARYYGAGQSPNPIHARTALNSMNAADLDLETQASMMQAMIVDLFAGLDSKETRSAKKNAKLNTGVASPTLINFRDFGDKVQELTAEKKSGWTTIKPGQPFQFKFAKKD